MLLGTFSLGTHWKAGVISCLRIHHWRCMFGEQLSICRYIYPIPYLTLCLVRSVMSVTVTRYRMDIILPAFAECLDSLPNLHTLELCHVHQTMTTKIKNAFEEVIMPSVRTVVLPTAAHHLLRSCPNVEDVTCTLGDGSQILGTIASKCPRVERISGTRPSLAMLQRRSSPRSSSKLLHLPPIQQV